MGEMIGCSNIIVHGRLMIASVFTKDHCSRHNVASSFECYNDEYLLGSTIFPPLPKSQEERIKTKVFCFNCEYDFVHVCTKQTSAHPP
mmetsp:Transcript_12609/g.26835  ORF Transcript_12609/g.26835 Transcript_12609/m.26835 type:complete len:88 (-) Transcript_12609:501-764(-)